MPVPEARHDLAPSPPPPERTLPDGACYRFDDGALRLSLSLDVYGLDAILRACYWITDRCYVYLAPPRDRLIEITLLAKDGGSITTDRLVWDFLNDLIDQRLRIDVNRETRAIREMIVAQAFAETDLIDDRGRPISDPSLATQDKPNADPEGIERWRPAS